MRYLLEQSNSAVRTSWYIFDNKTQAVAVVDGIERAQGMTRWEARQVLAHLEHQEEHDRSEDSKAR